MKYHLKYIVLVSFCLLTSMAGFALDYESFIVDGIGYKILSETDWTVAVTNRAQKYVELAATSRGNSPRKLPANYQYTNVNYNGNVVIPEEVTYDRRTYTVTEIGQYAFSTGGDGQPIWYNRNITGVTIPKSVINISKDAFTYGSSSIKTITIEDGKTELNFNNENIPSNVLESIYIGRKLVYANFPTGTYSVVFGDSVESVPENLFYKKQGISSVTLGKNITEIGNGAFCQAGVSKLVFSKKVKRIGSSAFAQTNIREVIFPEGLKTLGNRAFEDCKQLASAIFPTSVDSIHQGAFYGCTSLSKIVFADGDSPLYVEPTNIGTSNGGSYSVCCFNSCPIDSVYIGRTLKSTYPVGVFSDVRIVAIGKHVTSLFANTFKKSSIERVYSFQEEPIEIDKEAFVNATYTIATLFVPGGTVKKYQATSAWNDFASIVPTALLVTMTANEGGSVTLGDIVVTNETKTQEVKPSSVLTFEITPEDTHYLESVTLNGEDVTAQVVDGKLTPADLSEDLELTVTFKAKPFYVVTVTASAGGTATAGSESVMQGRCTTVTLAANEGYELKSVTVNGADKTSEVVDGVLTLSNIQENQTVVATFQKLHYTVTALECEHGNIELSATEVEWGDEVTATLAPDAHYEVATVSVNGEDRTAQVVDNRLTITDVRQNITIGATFRLERFALTATSNEGGTVLLSADEAEWGSSVTVTVSPENGYELVSVSVDGEDVTERLTANQYTIASVEHDTEVVVEFRLITEATITLSAYGESTYCSDHDLDFSGVEGLKAYIASGYDSSTGVVLLTRVTSVPAGTGVMVKGEQGTYKVPYSESFSYYLNMFIGNVEATSINPTEGEMTNLYLTTGSSGFGFYRVTKPRTMSANRARLQLPTSLLPAEGRVGLMFEDETEGIADLRIDNLRLDSSATYDLQGRKQEGRVKPGLYIRNGKKIVIH